jgi:hypothetical protein
MMPRGGVGSAAKPLTRPQVDEWVKQATVLALLS